MCEDNAPGLVRPEVPVAKNFELKSHILNMLQDIPFFGKDHEDAFKHIDEVLEIADYFSILNVTKDAVMLRAAKDWLKYLQSRTITTCANLREQFTQQFSPPSKVAILKKNIQKYQQLDGESLNEAWERHKGMLRNCQQHDMNVHQGIPTFYNGINVCTRQLLDS